MKKWRDLWVVTPVRIVLCAALLLFSIPVFFYNRLIFGVQLAVAVVLIGAVVWNTVRMQYRIQRYLTGAADSLDRESRTALEQAPMPVVLLSDSGEIVWYNGLFRGEVLLGEDHYGESVSALFEGLSTEQLSRRHLPCVTRGACAYVVHAVKLRRRDSAAFVLYFTDITELTQIATEYENSRPVVLSLYIDNSEEIMKKLDDVLSQIGEEEVENE